MERHHARDHAKGEIQQECARANREERRPWEDGDEITLRPRKGATEPERIRALRALTNRQLWTKRAKWLANEMKSISEKTRQERESQEKIRREEEECEEDMERRRKRARQLKEEAWEYRKEHQKEIDEDQERCR
jgi:hypothetical protein